MVTKFHMHKVRTTLGGFLLLGCLLAAHHSWSFLTTIKTVITTLDVNFSAECTALLQEKLSLHNAQTNSSATLLRSLRTQFTCIDTIEAQLYAPGCIAYTVTALLPRFAVNKQLALCDNNQLIPRSWYNQALYAQLPEITTAQPVQAGTAPAGLCRMAHHMPAAILDHYDVAWISDIETKLTLKKDPTFTISCNPTRSLLVEIAHCEQLYTDLSQHNPGVLHADIRFADQIVIHADQGRTVHG